MENNENLKNTKGKDEKIKEVYASLYLDALKRQLQEYDEGECTKFEEMDEEVLDEIDEVVEDSLEDVRPDLIIKRVKGLQFLIISREKYWKKLDEIEE